MIPSPRYRLIEHTADMGIEAWGTHPEDVLLAMARGLRAIFFGTSPAHETVRYFISLAAHDPVEMLVGWLNEIVFQCEANEIVPANFQMQVFRGHKIEATMTGEPFDPQRHMVEHQVKSVTYHQACFKKSVNGWYGRVYVDL